MTSHQGVSLLAAVLLLALTATVRAQGTLYVANYGGGTIDTINSSGVISTFASPFSGPDFLATDSGGNIYVSLSFGTTIEKYSSTGTDLGTYASGLSTPQGLAFDSSGDLFVANTGTNSILKITSGGTTSTFASSLNYPVGLAINSQGNIFVSNVSNDSIKVYNSAGTVLQTITTGLYLPGQLAFDSAGDLFVANQGVNGSSNFTIEKYTAVAGGTVSTVGTQFANTGANSQPTGLAFDPNGNLYVSYAYDSVIEEFNSAGVGTLFASGGNLREPAGLLYVEAVVPEPAVWALFPFGLAVFALLRSVGRRRGP